MKVMGTLTKRVLYVEGNLDGTIGGSYYSLFFLVCALDRTRYEPIVVFATDNTLARRLRDRGIRTVIRCPPSPTVLPGRAGRLLAKAANFVSGWVFEPIRLRRLLRAESIALVHLNNSVVKNHPWMIAALLAGIPCVTHERGINDVFQRRARILARRLDAVICISKAVHDNFAEHGLGRLRLVTVHNGLDPDEMPVTKSPKDVRRELGLPPESRLIGVVGNIKPWKGQELAVKATELLRDRFPDLVCLLIGDTAPSESAYRDALLGLVRELGLESRIVITGFREDVANYINALEIQVHASTSPEPFGRVLLEAMALCKPLVAANAGAVPEIVVHGETGLYFEPGSAASLAECVSELLQDPDRAVLMGERGRKRLDERFSIPQNVRATERVYADLLDE